MNRTLQGMLLSGASLLGIATIELGPTMYDSLNPLVETTTKIVDSVHNCEGSLVDNTYRCYPESVEKEIPTVRRKYDIFPSNSFGFNVCFGSSNSGSEIFRRVGNHRYEFHGIGGVEK